MTNIFNFFKRLSKSNIKPEEKDELIGIWENDLDDGSGLHAFWGWSFTFNEDGTGVYHYWSEWNDKYEGEPEYEIEFSWKRLNERSIEAKYQKDDEWSTIEYTLQVVNAPYDGKLFKLTDNNYKATEFSAEGFWNSFGAIFKSI